MSDSDTDYCDDEEMQTIVLDNGSGMVKAGFAGDDAPRAIFPNVVGRPRHQGVMVGMCQRDAYVGDEAISKRGILAMRYPMDHGVVTSWDDMEKVWHHTFYNELRVCPEEHTVLLSEVPCMEKAHREKSMQIMFETFDVPSLYMSAQPVLALYANGRCTGVVLDSGHGLTTTTPIYEGCVFAHAVNKMNFAGDELTQYMMQLLNDKGYSFTTSAEREIARDIKEKLCYTAFDFDADISESKRDQLIERPYELPDGQIIDINEERFKCAEVMFAPHLLRNDDYKTCEGVHQMMHDSILKCPDQLHAELFENIVLNGGNSMFRGMDDRLNHEIQKMVPKSMRVNVMRNTAKRTLMSGYLRDNERHIYSDLSGLIYRHYDDASTVSDIFCAGIGHRKYNIWIGGSILASLSTFEGLVVTKDEYDECGPGLVHRKCF
eukprot:CAMPEP_0202685804 /NCGR_PEP_ID=MMETSP1385-20130828/1651_1 /ASSEMBLY_ACC=CAM_ASM_000861 /TAXON_ID=933848 /ORGANISM="Elphidium margaritaceum" /LENGTH=432 /DNA_ID=CAMNT_0049340257 /DNA_START=43 /DNA_END=1341 /DNA_ORIENTATION=+